MKTIIIGGGKGCRSLLDLTRSSFLKEMHLDVIAVADINYDAPGMVYARENGIKTYTDYQEAISIPLLEVVVELTGRDLFRDKLYKNIGPGIKVIDHTIAKLFYEIDNARMAQEHQLFEMKELEVMLDKERYFLQSVFDSLQDLAVVLDRGHKLLRVNRKFAEFCGITPTEAVGKTCFEVLDMTGLACEEDLSRSRLESVFENKATVSFLKITPPPNENYWEITRAPIFDKSGKVVAALGTWHRITERIKLSHEKQSAEQKFKSFIYSAQDWISIKDRDGRYVIVNPVAANALKLKPSDFEGKLPDEILPPELLKTVKRHDKTVLETHQPHEFDEIINIDGKAHHFHAVRFPLTDYKGEVIGVCTIQRDNTKEIKLQEQLIQSEKLAALGKLAAGVAHEINNPLTGILAYAEDLIEEMPEQKEYVDDLNVIVRETLRCRDIVRNLLDFARQDKPRLESEKANDIIDNCVMLVERLPQFRDINLEVKKENNIPLIKCDPKQLQQVLLNFMLNAAEAMKYRGNISIITESDLREGNCIISVKDNGPGIPENLIDKIFEPFFSTKGTNGLGLAVSWGIIERHRGTIEIDMAEGGGAIFKIKLPLQYDKI